MSTAVVRTAKAEGPADRIVRHATMLSTQLQDLRERMYPPEARKSLRSFMTNEVSRLTSIPESTLKTMSIEGKGPLPSRLENNHRAYSLAQVNELRRPRPPRSRRRRCASFRTGARASICRSWASPTSRAAAPRRRQAASGPLSGASGYRVLAIDLDPQASLSAMFGAQPEIDVGENETVYAALRHDGDRGRCWR